MKLKRALRKKGKPVDAMFGVDGWRSGVVCRDNEKSFWLLMDDSQEKVEIFDKKGHWRPGMAKKRCCKCK